MECKKITKVSKNSQQNNSEKVTNGNDKEIPKDIYIYIYILVVISDPRHTECSNLTEAR